MLRTCSTNRPRMRAMPSTATPAMRSASEFLKVDEHTIPLSNSLAIRIYSDTRPHNLYLANLQKGLVLIYKDVERVGEGTGFGLPVLQYSNGLYFSRSSEVFLFELNGVKAIRKEFLMDTVQRKKIRKVNLENRRVRATFEYVEELYRRHQNLRILSLKKASGMMGLKTNFAEIKPMGKVSVTYTLGQGDIRVKADLCHVRRECLKRVFMLNEQGSQNFTRYSDSSGRKLIGRRIGAWEIVDANEASITDLHGRIGFRLHGLENGIMRRGREYLKGRLDWIGLDYEIDPSRSAFEYGIEILGR